jgi:hypothetical protein
MKSFRLLRSCAIVLPLLALAVGTASADVKNREKGQVKFEGMLGTMTRMFGGKAASEGIVSTNALKGSRKATLNDTTGRIVDLQEEKVYDLDMKKKEYTVTTFAELRKKLQEAQERCAEGDGGAKARQRKGSRIRLRRQRDRTKEVDRRLRRPRGRDDAYGPREREDARRGRRSRRHDGFVAGP